VLRIFGPKWEEVMGGWRKLHNDEFHDLYFSPNTIRVIKSRRIGLECSMHGRDEKYEILVGNPEGKRPLGPRAQMTDGRIILEWILEK